MSDTNWLSITSFAAVLGAASWLLAWCARRVLTDRGVVDVPNHRSSHSRTVPSGGGVVIVLLTTLGSIVGWLWHGTLGAPAVVMLVGATLLAVLGFEDDRHDLSVLLRLAVQLIVCLAVTAAIVLPTRPGTAMIALSLPIVGIALVGATNIYNFMDGIDGIAAATAVSFGLTTLLLGALASDQELIVVGAVMIAVNAGFLIHNWNPASIFMGDSGSLYLGLLTSGLALLAVTRHPRGVALIGALAPFLVDGTLTILRRLRRGERLTEAHRSHLYQRASRRWGHALTSIAYAVTGTCTGSALLLVSARWPAALSTTLVMVLFTVVIWVAMSVVVGEGELSALEAGEGREGLGDQTRASGRMSSPRRPGD